MATDSKEAAEEWARKKSDERQKRLPDFLYKFRFFATSHDSTVLERALIGRELYWQSPINFNDPFDCAPTFTYAASKSKKETYEKDIVNRLNPGLPRSKRLMLRSKMRKKSPKSVEREMASSQEEMRRQISLCCLTENCTHPLMWAHYADSHQGLCLRMTLDDTDRDWMAFPVTYQRERPVVDIIGKKVSELLDLVALTKADFWSYEQEWRTIDQKAGAGYRKLGKGRIDGVIIGALMPNSKQEELFDIIERSGLRIETFRASIDPKVYGLNIRSHKRGVR